MVDFPRDGHVIGVVPWEAEVAISRNMRVMTANHFARTIVHALLMSVHVDNTASSHPNKDRRAIEVSTTLRPLIQTENVGLPLRTIHGSCNLTSSIMTRVSG